MSWASMGSGASTAGSTAGTVGTTASTAGTAGSAAGMAGSAGSTAGTVGSTAGTAGSTAGGFSMPVSGQVVSQAQPSVMERFSAGAGSSMRDMLGEKKMFGNNPETYGYLTKKAVDNAPPVKSPQLQEQPSGGGFRVQTPVRRYGRY